MLRSAGDLDCSDGGGGGTRREDESSEERPSVWDPVGSQVEGGSMTMPCMPAREDDEGSGKKESPAHRPADGCTTRDRNTCSWRRGGWWWWRRGDGAAAPVSLAVASCCRTTRRASCEATAPSLHSHCDQEGPGGEGWGSVTVGAGAGADVYGSREAFPDLPARATRGTPGGMNGESAWRRARIHSRLGWRRPELGDQVRRRRSESPWEQSMGAAQPRYYSNL